MHILDKKYAKTIKDKRYPNERVEVIEMDELYSFIERKKQNLRNNSSEWKQTSNRRL